MFQTNISVCIPVYIRSPKDLLFLKKAIYSINNQIFRPREVVVSVDNIEQKEIDAIKKVVDSSHNPVKLIFNRDAGLSNNTNHALDGASGEIIKILFQDDYLATPLSLFFTKKAFSNSDVKWLVSVTKIYLEDSGRKTKKFYPKLSDNLLDGKNTISSPSVVALRKKNLIPFDKEMRMLMDCEWYVRMSHHFGPPTILPHVLAINRSHDGQEQKRNPGGLELESAIAKKRHRNQRMMKQDCECTRENRV